MSSASRFLRRAAIVAALAGTAAAALPEETLWGVSVRSSRPSPHDGPATRGHLGLVRAHPGLRDLNSALASRDAFFLDAAHALAASVLRVRTITGAVIREWCSPNGLPKDIAAAESRGDLDAVVRYGFLRAILEAREGRLDEALAAAVQLTRDSPGDPRPRIAAAALCFLHGRSGTGSEWMKNVPGKEGLGRFVNAILSAMPGSSLQSVEEHVDRMVILLACMLMEDLLFLKLETGEWSILEKLEFVVFRTWLRHFVSKHPPAAGAYPVTMSMVLDNINSSQVNKLLMDCSQAILAQVLRARPICGERLREMRALSERALVDVEAEGDDLAAVDVNLLLAFLAVRDGHFNEALQRYKAAVRKDPSDCRPYELAAMLCSITGQAVELDAWQQDSKQHGRATNGRAAPTELPALLDELVVAAGLGSGFLMTLTQHGQGQWDLTLLSAWREVDAGLTAALLDKDLTLVERLQIRLLRSILHAKMQPLLDIANQRLKKYTDH